MIRVALLFCTTSIAHSVWVWFGPPSWRPRIGCHEARFDFGERQVDDRIVHQFPISNTGRTTLHVTGVHLDCGCMTSDLTECWIPPGRSVALPVHLSLEHQRSGELLRRVIVDSTDPRTPHLLLIMKGRISGARQP